jgi:hypothetical protein
MGNVDMLCVSQGRNVCRSVRIVQSVRTVKWLYGPVRENDFSDREPTLSICKVRQRVMSCLS